MSEIEIEEWNIGASTFRATPTMGALLMSWQLKLASENRTIIYWPDDVAPSANGDIRGGNPILFPFCGRSSVGSENFCWIDSDKNKRPMRMHGYALQGDFLLESMRSDGFTALYKPCEASKKAYPYQYAFRVEYIFEELSLAVKLKLHNQDKAPIPWSAGHHFYFKLPWHLNNSRNNYRLQILSRKAYKHGKDGSLIKLEGPSTSIPFSDPNMKDRLHCHIKENPIKFGPLNGEEDISIYIGEGRAPHKWNTCVTWAEYEESPYYCVEPWMGLPNAPSHKKGLHFVSPGEESCFSTRVSL